MRLSNAAIKLELFSEIVNKIEYTSEHIFDYNIERVAPDRGLLVK